MEKPRQRRQRQEDLLDYPERHDLPVLNAAEPTHKVRELLEQSGKGEVIAKKVGMFDYTVPTLRGFTVIPVYLIKN